MLKGIFITGTDTGVGKTFVASGLLRAFNEMGYKVCPMKPVETGCKVRDGRLIPHDGMKLIKASGVKEPLDIINPYRFKLPLAPSVAAELEGVRIHKRKIISTCRYLLNKYEVTIVEGAGGIMVPIYKRYLYRDLIKELDLPVVIVSRPGLGTINHTLLTIEVAKSRGIEVIGIIINYAVKTKRDPSEKTNPEILSKISGIPILGVIPYLNDPKKVFVNKKIYYQIAKKLF